MYGHSRDQCRKKKTRQEWRPKRTLVDPAPEPFTSGRSDTSETRPQARDSSSSPPSIPAQKITIGNSSSSIPLPNARGPTPMDRLCAWNIRSLNWPIKQEDLKLFLHKQQVGFMALVETKIKQANFERIATRVVPGWHSSHNLHYSPTGRIWMAWKPSLFQVQTLEASDQFINCRVHMLQPRKLFYLTIVYGHNQAEARQPLWDALCRIAQTMDEAWCVMGDFNAVLYQEDH